MTSANENINPQNKPYTHLEELSNSDYEMKDGEPDIIGWNVTNSEGRKLGEVDELIFDPQERKVRYLVLNMDSNELDLEDERRVLIPIGIAQLDNQDDLVSLPHVTTTHLKGLPPYEGCPEVTALLEMKTREVLEGSRSPEHGTAPYDQPQFYAHDHFDEDRFYGRVNLPANETIIPAEDMATDGSSDRQEKVSRVLRRINRSGEQIADDSAKDQ